MKTCTKCEEVKELGEFHRNKGTNDGMSTHCKKCVSVRGKEYYKENKGKFQEKGKDYRKRNSKKLLERDRKWKKENRFATILIRSRAEAKRSNHIPCNATVEELEMSFTGRCGICGVPQLELMQHLAMDHNHTTGEFRGWLCRRCNTALGLLGDNEELLIDAIHYLMSYEQRKTK